LILLVLGFTLAVNANMNAFPIRQNVPILLTNEKAVSDIIAFVQKQ